MTSITTTLEQRIGEQYLEIDISFSYDITNDGIGAYEFWGHRCFDKGNESVELDDTFQILRARLGKRRLTKDKIETKGFKRLAESMFEEAKDSLINDAWADARDRAAGLD